MFEARESSRAQAVTILPDEVKENSFFYPSQKNPPSPLAASLLQIPGVKSVLLGHSYVSVTKEDTSAWDELEHHLREMLKSHLDQEKTIIETEGMGEPAAAKEESPRGEGEDDEDGEDDDDDEDVVSKVKSLIDIRVRPFVQSDGGDVEFIRFDDANGVVWVHMKGSCEGCPSSTITVKRGMAEMLKYFIPEVEDVRTCDENGDPLDEGEDDA